VGGRRTALPLEDVSGAEGGSKGRHLEGLRYRRRIRPLLSGSRLGLAENEVLAVAYDRLQEVFAKRYPFVEKDRT
jgi:hypothetical protein